MTQLHKLHNKRQVSVQSLTTAPTSHQMVVFNEFNETYTEGLDVGLVAVEMKVMTTWLGIDASVPADVDRHTAECLSTAQMTATRQSSLKLTIFTSQINTRRHQHLQLAPLRVYGIARPLRSCQQASQWSVVGHIECGSPTTACGSRGRLNTYCCKLNYQRH